ncbi:MAG: GAF domain-containing protein [Ignavibacterium sp.]|nr:GAF domain-containing protein [Ignavibacterium sp.]MDW8375219.1 GAF domain-containing protein [Ignavibacteriales bacterium]
MISKRLKKRLLTFIFVPILIALAFIIDDMIVKIGLLILLSIYIGFIIFLRDSVRMDGKLDYDETEEANLPEELLISEKEDGFKIISKTTKVETSTYGNIFNTHTSEKLIPPDLKEKYDQIANEPLLPDLDSKEMFSFALEKILYAISETILCYSVLFFWYDKKANSINLHKYVSQSQDIIIRKFNVDNDILSKIIHTTEPQLLNNIPSNSELDNIIYYEKPQGIKSFVGVPLFFDGNLVGIIALDSKGPDSFGIETIFTLGRFIRVIALMIQIFDEKHRDQQSQKRLNAILNFLNLDFTASYEDLLNSIPESVRDFFDWDLFTIVFYNKVENKYKIIKISNNTKLKYIEEGADIDLENSIVGKSLLKMNPINVGNIDSVNFNRYNKTEDIKGFASFLVVPIEMKGKSIGAFCFESLKSNHFTNSDIKFIKSASKFLGYIVENLYSRKVLENLVTIDFETLVLNGEAFKQRLKEELFKAKSAKIPGVLALIKIDDFIEQSNLFEQEPFQIVLKEILLIIKRELNPHTLFGRLSNRVFGAYFFNADQKNVFVWAEKLRTNIARHTITIGTTQNSYTVSIGLYTTLDKTDVDEVLQEAEITLMKAVNDGGNRVTQYSNLL